MDQHQIQHQANHFIEHDMIKKYTKIPAFPRFRTSLLYTFLKRSSPKNAQQSELFSLVTSLVQLGLDTHDQVDNIDQSDFLQTRSQQLKVLAGDYFSGCFYQLLSQAEQIDLIQKLSLAICEVNRIKLNLYVKMKHFKLTAEEYLQHTLKIKSELYMSFTHLMTDAYQTYWPELLHGFTKCEIMADEIEKIENTDRFIESYGYWYLLRKSSAEEQQMLRSGDIEADMLEFLVEKYGLKNHMHQQFEAEYKKMGQQVEKFRSKKLMTELKKMGEAFQCFLPKSTVLEGIIK